MHSGRLLPPYSEETDASAKEPSKSKALFTVGGVGLGCLLIIVLVLSSPFGFLLIPLGQLWSSGSNRSEYRRNQEFYDALIRRIETDLAQPGYGASYVFPKSPEGLKRIDWTQVSECPYFFMRKNRMISGQRLQDGRLRVSFETSDMGHAGYWFLLYVSDGLLPDDVYPAEGIKVAPQWWAVEDRSG